MESMLQEDVLIQYLINEREKLPVGFRILATGALQRPAKTNLPPAPMDNLEKDRAIIWETERDLTSDQLGTIKLAINSAKFFDLPSRLLINYCKDDPGTGIWWVNLDGQSARVVVFDPRPKRSPEIDQLLAAVNKEITAQA